MIFQKFNITHKPLLHFWANDPDTQKHLGGMFPLDDFVSFLLTAKNRSTHIVFFNKKPIGMTDVEFYPKEKKAAMSLLIAPEERGKNYGKRVLEKLVQLPEFECYHQLDAFIEPENIASIKCFEKAGFKKIKEEVDEDGVFEFSYFF